MLLALAFMAASAAPSPAPTPRTIIRIKSSPLCNELRDTVAPIVQGLVIQDRMIEHGNVLMGDMQRMQIAHAAGWLDMDNERLGRIVLKLADNNIQIHELLDRLAEHKLQSDEEAAEVATLRQTLLRVADHQADSLNFLSGTSESIASNEVLAGGDAVVSMAIVEKHQVAGPPYSNVSPSAAGVPPITAGDAAKGVVATQQVAGNDESLVMPALAPILDRCR